MRRATVSAAAGVLLVLLGGCGGSGSHTAGNATVSTLPASTSPPATGNAPSPAAIVALSRHLLTAADLPGFTKRGPLSTNTKAGGWARESEPEATPAASSERAARLERLGFAAGASQQLQATGGGGGEGVSVAEKLGSPAAAKAELQAEATALSSKGLTFFAVPAIPGARGLATTPGGRFTGFNVAFAKGPYYHLVGVGYPAGSSSPPTRAQLISAAQRLYARVPG